MTLTKKQRRMKFAVAWLKEYMLSYDKQACYMDYDDKTFIDDVLYGLGVSLRGSEVSYVKGYALWKQMLRDHLEIARPVAWDASDIKQPGWNHVSFAFIEGAKEARANPDATEQNFIRAADGYTKRVFEEVDPVSEKQLRTGDWNKTP